MQKYAWEKKGRRQKIKAKIAKIFKKKPQIEEFAGPEKCLAR